MKYGRKKLKKKNCKRLFQGVVLFFVIFMIVFRGVFVSAGMNDSKLEKNRKDGIYAIATSNNGTRLFYLNMYTLNGIVSYCVDIGVDITTDIYHSTSDFKISTLTKEQIDYIQVISYFGYLYPGHEDYRYYMAAQELIWEYISNHQVEWTNEESVNGTRINISAYKQEILYLREKYYGGVYFNTYPVGKILDLGTIVKIPDSSGLISEYEVSSSGHSKAWIEDGNLVIQVATDYVGNDTIELTRKNVYSYDTKLYYYDNSQRLVSAGNFGKMVNEFTFSIRGVSLDFVLVDGESGESVPKGQASFDGIVYGLYDKEGNFLEEIVMGNDTTSVSVDNLAYGEYIVKQSSTGVGYRLNNKDILISFTSDTELPVELSVFPDYQEVELFKVYDVQGEGIYEPEVGISFSVYDKEDHFYGEMITDENGLASILLPYGYYKIQQNNTTFGYEKVEDFEILVDPTESEKKRYDLVNEFIECQLKIMVSDSDFSDVNLGSGFAFKIWDYAQEKYLEKDGQEIFFTDENGVLMVPILVGYGKYLIEQVDVSDRFVNMHQQLEVVIDEHSEFLVLDEKLQLEFEFLQKRILGEVRVITEKEIFLPIENDYKYEFQIRPNVELELISQEDIVFFDQLLYEKGSVIQVVSTNENGICDIENLELGKYCLKEKETGIEECFELSLPVKKKDRVSMEVHLQLLLEKMNIELFHKNEIGDVISDTVVEVMDQDGQVIYTGVTDENGEMKIQSLPSGSYCFHQKKINVNYALNKENVCVSIDNSKRNWEVQMINQLVSKKWIEIPNTLDDGENIIQLVCLLLFIGLGGYFYYKKVCHFHD